MDPNVSFAKEATASKAIEGATRRAANRHPRQPDSPPESDRLFQSLGESTCFVHPSPKERKEISEQNRDKKISKALGKTKFELELIEIRDKASKIIEEVLEKLKSKDGSFKDRDLLNYSYDEIDTIFRIRKNLDDLVSTGKIKHRILTNETEGLSDHITDAICEIIRDNKPKTQYPLIEVSTIIEANKDLIAKNVSGKIENPNPKLAVPPGGAEALKRDIPSAMQEMQ